MTKGARSRRPAASSTWTGSRPRRSTYSSAPAPAPVDSRRDCPTDSGASRPAESIPRQPFPADIVYDIFLRLPVKTLKRFRFACKQWYSLISSTKFRHDHFHGALHKPCNPHLLTLRQIGPSLQISTYDSTDGAPVNKFSRKLSKPYFDGNEEGKPFSESCRGLVCIASWSLGHPPILVCNPATEELIALPTTHVKEWVMGVGFGYAPVTKEFKVVKIIFKESTILCQVFTLGTGSWRQSMTPPFSVYRGRAPFLHGALHFLPMICGSVKETDHIAAFDLDTEEFRGIRLPDFYYTLGNCLAPENPSVGSNFIRMSVLRGALCLTFDYGAKRGRLEMWTLKDYENVDWVKGYTINILSVYHRCPIFGFWAYPSDSMAGEIIVNCSDERGHKLVSFNPDTGLTVTKNETEWAATLYEETFYPLRPLNLAIPNHAYELNEG